MATIKELEATIAAANAQTAQMMAGMAQMITQLANNNGGTQPEADIIPIDTAEMKLAVAKRHEAIVEAAAPLVTAWKLAYQDFDVFVKSNICSGAAYNGRNQHFRSRRMAEFQANKLYAMQESGSRSGVRTGEIDDYGQAEDMMKVHSSAMEQYEILLVAAEIYWIDEVENEARQQDIELKFTPSFDISEQAFAAYDEQEQNRFRNSTKTSNKANKSATRALARTESHFLGRTA